MTNRATCAAGLAFVALLFVPPAPAQESAGAGAEAPPAEARFYTTREERREAGVKHVVARWLTVSGLLEAEGIQQRYGVRGDPARGGDGDYATTVQLGVDLLPAEWLLGEVVYELEDSSEPGSNPLQLDEAVLAVELDDFELEFGRLFVPFGEYFSHFVSGPILEFGETGGRGAVLSWSPDDRLEASAFTYRGRARPAGQRRRDWDWGAAIEAKPFSFGTVAVSYLSDLGDSEERLLEDDGDRYQRRVPGLSAYLLLGAGSFEFTAEGVRALKSFLELDPDRDRPEAWNAELAWFPSGSVQVALRVEGSREIEDAPELQGGIAVAWGFSRYVNLTLEYLQGRYRRGLAEDPQDRELDDVYQFGAQVAVAF